MSAVSENIVREFFELHGFLVRQHRKFIAPSKQDDDEIDFFVYNPNAQPGTLPFVLGSGDLARVVRGFVVVKGWHTETFSSAVLTGAPEIFRFVEPSVLQQGLKAFGGLDNVTKILVVPALPSGEEARDQSIALLKEKGVDAILPFRTVLGDLVHSIESNRNYQKSDILQVLRVLKNYDFFKEPQLELFKASRRPRKRVKGAEETEA